MALSGIIDDRFLIRYRELLDAEDEAFDSLEHRCENGDRSRFDGCLQAWWAAAERKMQFLHRVGVVAPPALTI